MKTLAVIFGALLAIYLLYRYLTRDELYYNPDEDESRRKLSSGERNRYKQFALEFANALVKGSYDSAASMLNEHLSKQWKNESLKKYYNEMIEYGDGAATHVEVMETMDDWPDRKIDDIGWAYVAISGDGFNEAVTVVVSKKDGLYKISDIEWGRP